MIKGDSAGYGSVAAYVRGHLQRLDADFEVSVMDNFKVLIDLDGVLVNFWKGMCVAHGWDLATPDLDDDMNGLSAKEFWKVTTEPGFFENLEWMPDGKELLDIAVRKVGWHRIAICSSPPSNPICAAGKITWIKREIPLLKRQFLIGTPKWFAAAPNTILIDDMKKNIDGFIQEGGLGVLIPNQGDRTKIVEEKLNEIIGTH